MQDQGVYYRKPGLVVQMAQWLDLRPGCHDSVHTMRRCGEGYSDPEGWNWCVSVLMCRLVVWPEKLCVNVMSDLSLRLFVSPYMPFLLGTQCERIL
jgi:hypothetical protein